MQSNFKPNFKPNTISIVPTSIFKVLRSAACIQHAYTAQSQFSLPMLANVGKESEILNEGTSDYWLICDAVEWD